MAPDSPVYLHVYDLIPQRLNKTQYVISGKPLFHAAVEVHGQEWCYGAGQGIEFVAPGSAECYAAHRDPIPLGHTQLSQDEIFQLIGRMEENWQAEDYNLLSKNCCTFARTLLEELGAQPMPGWVDRAARRGFESFASTGVQAVGLTGMRFLATRAAVSVPFQSAAGPAGWAAMGGELVGGHVGGLVGENVAGNSGKQVGENIGRLGGAVSAGAVVGAVLAGPVGAGVGAGLGCTAYAVGKAATWVVKKADPNKRVSQTAVAAFQSSGVALC